MTVPQFSFGTLFLLSAISVSADEPSFPAQAKRVLFLGDSITHAGHYISLIECSCERLITIQSLN